MILEMIFAEGIRFYKLTPEFSSLLYERVSVDKLNAPVDFLWICQIPGSFSSMHPRVPRAFNVSATQRTPAM
jgi:hypothetical protein